MTVYVAKHEYFHVHPFESFARISKFILGTLVFIIALLLFASTVFMVVLLSMELISG